MSRGQWLALTVTAVIVVAVVAVAGTSPFVGGPGKIVTDHYAAPLGPVRALDARIQMGAGRLRLRTIESGNAYEAAITHSAGVRVEVTFGDGRLLIAESRSRGGRRTTNDWEIGISRAVPVTLVVSTGAGRAKVDLTGLPGSATVTAGAGRVEVEFGPGNAAVDRLEFTAGAGRFSVTGLGNAHARTIEARAGVGEFTLDFSGTSTGTTDVTVRGGVGRLVLAIPPDLGVHLKLRAGVGGTPNLEGFTQIGDDEYADSGWTRSGPKLDVEVNLGVGGFEIRRRR